MNVIERAELHGALANCLRRSSAWTTDDLRLAAGLVLTRSPNADTAIRVAVSLLFLDEVDREAAGAVGAS